MAFPLTGAFHWFLEMLQTFSSLVRCDMRDISRNQWEVAEDKRSPVHAVSVGHSRFLTVHQHKASRLKASETSFIC